MAAIGTNPFASDFRPRRARDHRPRHRIGDVGRGAADGAPGQALPEGIGFDAEGRPTRDARAVGHPGGVSPFGGHKGYGLSFAVQALGSACGGGVAPRRCAGYGFLFIAIEPAVMLPEDVSLHRWRSLSRASRRRRASLGWMKSAYRPSVPSANANSAASRASCVQGPGLGGSAWIEEHF